MSITIHDIAKLTGLNASTVSRALRRDPRISEPTVLRVNRAAEELGYVMTEGMHIFLTELGRSRAETVYEKHITLRRFLVALGVGGEAAERDACLIEHIIGDETYEAVKRFLSARES